MHALHWQLATVQLLVRHLVTRFNWFLRENAGWPQCSCWFVSLSPYGSTGERKRRVSAPQFSFGADSSDQVEQAGRFFWFRVKRWQVEGGFWAYNAVSMGAPRFCYAKMGAKQFKDNNYWRCCFWLRNGDVGYQCDIQIHSSEVVPWAGPARLG